MRIIESKIEQVKNQLINATSLKQTCKIYVTTTDGNNRSFYFKQGYLVWASSSVHRFRRLYRLIEKICPEVNFEEFKLREQEISELWEYLALKVLYKRQQISLKQAIEVVREVISEVLFDCLLESDRIEEFQVILKNQINSMAAILESPLLQQTITQVNYEIIIEHLESMVADWTANLPDCLPNHAPVVVVDKLSESIDYDADRELFMYIDGGRTFRDLAILSRQNLPQIAHSIAPFIDNKSIVVDQVEDRPIANLYFASPDPLYPATQPRKYLKELDLPLIVYVNNDADRCQQAIEILNSAGYQIIAVNDATKTLIVLLKNRPSLIVINANKSDISNYELCAQIKKVSKLKNVPIIISRDREQMLDRVRAKIAGVSDFITKPIKPEELLALAQKYTQAFLSD